VAFLETLRPSGQTAARDASRTTAVEDNQPKRVLPKP
jgi:hypothetical protein